MTTEIDGLKLFPPIKRRTVALALLTAFGDISTVHSEFLSKGLSGALLYKLTVPEGTYILRIVTKPNEVTDCERHFQCLRIASEAGIAPKVIYTNVENGITISEFFECIPLFEGFIDRDELIGELGVIVAGVHALPVFPAFLTFTDAVDQLVLQFQSFRMFPEAVTSDVFHYYQQMKDKYRTDERDMVSSHNDLHPSNFLLTNSRRLLVVDWESAFRNDRYVDLAIVSQSFGLNEKDSELLLSSYFEEAVTSRNRAKFFLMQQVCQLYQGLLMLKFAAACKPHSYKHDYDFQTIRLYEVNRLIQSGQLILHTYEGQLYYGKVCMNEALINFRSDKFSVALSSL